MPPALSSGGRESLAISPGTLTVINVGLGLRVFTKAEMNADLALVTIDTRPIFARGDTPCQAIDAAVAGLAPGQSLELIAPFEPVPLYVKLGRQGFSHETRQAGDRAWHVTFRKTPESTGLATVVPK